MDQFVAHLTCTLVSVLVSFQLGSYDLFRLYYYIVGSRTSPSVTSYSRDRGAHAWIRMIIALPFLPEDQISSVFRKLKRKAATGPLQELAEYVEDTWITSTTWAPHPRAFTKPCDGTKNNVEGWHNGPNRHAQRKSQLPLYMLIMLLHEESKLTSLQIRLVSERKRCRILRKTNRQLQSIIFNLWDRRENGEQTIKQLLLACAHLYGPRDE